MRFLMLPLTLLALAGCSAKATEDCLKVCDEDLTSCKAECTDDECEADCDATSDECVTACESE